MNQLNKIISVAIFSVIIVLFDFIDFTDACHNTPGFQCCLENCRPKNSDIFCFRKCLIKYCN